MIGMAWAIFSEGQWSGDASDKELFNEVDANSDGFLNLNEYLKAAREKGSKDRFIRRNPSSTMLTRTVTGNCPWLSTPHPSDPSEP